ncbi:MAG: hypothetical protein H8E26_14130 [FCB group bacterium]|nr:hypothetical protein [FCB group bacterium]MBL7027422.1 hypothetical protein [Candidatus Neomarinimicrobiota bacterium]MBL7122596.1 hypothetical protein [Candidatus Neomarinimicrobiota bacterium]
MRKIQRVGINFSTIAAAIAASSAGDLVQVLPGVYEEEDLVLKNGVNIEFMPGAEMTQSAADIAAEAEYTAFTDGGNDVVCSIGGRPKFTFYGSTDLIELTGTSVVSYYGKPEYSYTDALSWTSEAKITFEAGPDVKVYRALLTQAGAGAPVATVLENTLGGEIVWSRPGVGTNRGTLAGAFPAASTFISFSQNGAGQYFLSTPWSVAADYIEVLTMYNDGLAMATDGLFNGAIEILVYP